MNIKKGRTKGIIVGMAVLLFCSCTGMTAGAASKPEKTSFTNQSEAYAKKIVLRWRKAKGAGGYEICRSERPNGEYRKIKTITKPDRLQWTDEGLKKGKTYYYKIRAYRKVEKKKEKICGAYSSPFKKDAAGWVYKNGYKLYYDSDGKLVRDVSKYIGKQSSYVLMVNKQKNVVTVYAKDGKNGYIIPVKAFICATGQATPVGTFYTPQRYRWLLLVGPCYGQWCTGIQGDFLFHSSPYKTKNNNDLDVQEYNKLGTTCSHGCVRLQAGDAKWIYDNCRLGTKVVIYYGSSPGPLGKPKAERLSASHKWDPTDPDRKKSCKRKGCHWSPPAQSLGRLVRRR